MVVEGYSPGNGKNKVNQNKHCPKVLNTHYLPQLVYTIIENGVSTMLAFLSAIAGIFC